MSVRWMKQGSTQIRLFALALAVSPVLRAQESVEAVSLPSAESVESRPAASYRHHLAVETGAVSIDYKEDLKFPAKSTETGILPAIGVRWSMRPSEDSFWELEVAASHARGKLDYAGSLQSLGDPDSPVNGKPAYHTDSHSVSTVEAQLGFPIASNFWARIGYEARFWNRGVDKFSEFYRMSFVPVSLQWRHLPTEGLGGSVEAGLRPLVRGDMIARMSELHPALDDVTLPLGLALGARASAQVSYTFHSGFRLGLSSWYRNLNIGLGEPEYVTSGGEPIYSPNGPLQILEPASRTHEFGLTLSGVMTL